MRKKRKISEATMTYETEQDITSEVVFILENNETKININEFVKLPIISKFHSPDIPDS